MELNNPIISNTYPLSNLHTLSETNRLGDYFPFRKACVQPGSKTTNGPARMVKGALHVVWWWGSFSVRYLKVLRMTITWMIRTFSLYIVIFLDGFLLGVFFFLGELNLKESLPWLKITRPDDALNPRASSWKTSMARFFFFREEWLVSIWCCNANTSRRMFLGELSFQCRRCSALVSFSFFFFRKRMRA